MLSPFDPSLSRSERMLAGITAAQQQAEKAPRKPVETISPEELCAYVSSLAIRTEALLERPSTILGVDLAQLADLVQRAIESRREAREELKRLC